VHDVPNGVDEVDVLIGVRVEADAAIETAIFGLAPWLSRNYNTAWATARAWLNWMSRPTPQPRTGGERVATVTAEHLHRAPDTRESASRLARKAAEAEAEPTIGLHGVSAFDRPLDRPHSKALRSDVEKEFPVKNTGGPGHRTIVLPKPVTAAVADIFNRIFGRK
jgi:hypothetical protein